MPRKLTAEQTSARDPELEKARLRTEARRIKDKADHAKRREEKEAELEAKRNRLLDLPEEERAKLFMTLRDCPYNDAVLQMLAEKGIVATPGQLTEFFQVEAERHWEMRIQRAAFEANALVRLAEENPTSYSSGMLAALGQETFRQIASGRAQPESMNRMATLFLRAKADERADQMSELKREKLRQEMRGSVELAFEKIAEQVEKNPAAQAAFEALQRELAGKEEA